VPPALEDTLFPHITGGSLPARPGLRVLGETDRILVASKPWLRWNPSRYYAGAVSPLEFIGVGGR